MISIRRWSAPFALAITVLVACSSSSSPGGSTSCCLGEAVTGGTGTACICGCPSYVQNGGSTVSSMVEAAGSGCTGTLTVTNTVGESAPSMVANGTFEAFGADGCPASCAAQ
jgi:hypothetical protein